MIVVFIPVNSNKELRLILLYEKLHVLPWQFETLIAKFWSNIVVLEEIMACDKKQVETNAE